MAMTYGLQILEAEKQKTEIAIKAKSNFLASISQELRTPLHAIHIISEILKDHKELLTFFGAEQVLGLLTIRPLRAPVVHLNLRTILLPLRPAI